MIKLLLICLGCIVVSAQRNQDCTTPTNEPGQCIPIDKCSELYNLASKLKKLTQEEIAFLRSSGCGWQNQQPKVCCPLPSTPAPTPQKRPTSSNLLPNTQTCGFHEADRIVGGELTGIKEFPWAVLVEYNTPEGRGFKCGGVLISKRYVLTAAHCIRRVPRTWTLISVRLGEHDISKKKDCEDERPGFEDCADPPIDIPVEQIIAHNQYKITSVDEHDDIALLRLSKEVTFTKYVTPICLPPSNFLNQKYDGLNMTVAGWGRTEDGTPSDVKLKLIVPVEANSQCFPKYKKAGAQLWNKQFCAGGVEGQDSCKGDSGGPLMYEQTNWYVTGVVSFGPRRCGTKGFPGIYTKVADYNDWIISNMRA